VIKIETRLSLTVGNFADDFVKAFDKINHPSVIQSLWHVSEDLAKDLYEVSLEFLNSNTIGADGESEEGDFGLTDEEDGSECSSDHSVGSEESCEGGIPTESDDY